MVARIMLVVLMLATLAMLTACGGGGSSPAPYFPVSSPLHSVQLAPASVPVYPRPQQEGPVLWPMTCVSVGCAKLGYVTQNVTASIAGKITIDYEIVESGGPTYHYKLNPDNTCEGR